MRHAFALVLTGLGVGITVLSCVFAACAADTLPRLHYTAPITSVGVPLIGLGLIVQSGVGMTAASVLVVIVVTGLSGPFLTTAIGRVAAQREGVLPPEEPK